MLLLADIVLSLVWYHLIFVSNQINFLTQETYLG